MSARQLDFRKLDALKWCAIFIWLTGWFLTVHAQVHRVPPSLISYLVSTPNLPSERAYVSVQVVFRDGGPIDISDQFEASLASDFKVLASLRTTGTGARTIGSIANIAVAAQTRYFINVRLLRGASSPLQYEFLLSCQNTRDGGTSLAHISQINQPILLANLDRAQCRMTIFRLKPYLTLHLQTLGGVGVFGFSGKFTGIAGGFIPVGYTLETVQPGSMVESYRFRLQRFKRPLRIAIQPQANSGLLGASCVNRNAHYTQSPMSEFGDLQGNVLLLQSDDVQPAADIHCTFRVAFLPPKIEGRVILDNGTGGGLAHDGVQNGRELGQAGVAVELSDCLGTRYSQTISTSDGSYQLSTRGIAGGALLCVKQRPPPGFHAVSRRSEAATDRQPIDMHQIRIRFEAGQTVEAPTFGNVAAGRLSMGAQQSAGPGKAAVFRHTYDAGTHGSVEFSFVARTDAESLSEVLYWDTQCAGVLGDDAIPFPPELEVEAGDHLCLLVKLTSRPGTLKTITYESVIEARELWEVSTLYVWQKEFRIRSVNSLSVVERALTLTKEWRRVPECPANGRLSQLDLTPYTTAGSASPGDWIEYRITFSNMTDGPLHAISLHDAVPQFTQFHSAYCLPLDLSGIQHCTVQDRPTTDAGLGTVRWSLLDASGALAGLQPQEAGAVNFCVRVEP